MSRVCSNRRSPLLFHHALQISAIPKQNLEFLRCFNCRSREILVRQYRSHHTVIIITSCVSLLNRLYTNRSIIPLALDCIGHPILFCENVCYALRTSQLFNTPNMSRSAYVAKVEAKDCRKWIVFLDQRQRILISSLCCHF